MKQLNGSELASFIKERQAKQVRALRQAEHIIPTLAVVRCDNDNPVISTYVRLKKRYGADILIEVNEYCETPETVEQRLHILKNDDATHGIIVQLPVEPSELTSRLIAQIPPSKDVDGLTADPMFDAATPTAITWLLVGYGIDIATKKIAIVGAGQLVGAPLSRRWKKSGYDVTVFEKDDGNDLSKMLPHYDVIITATGAGGLITSEMLPQGAIVVDAGTSSENGVVVGDLAAEVRHERQDLTITPEKGGVGPLTVSALFDNVIIAARRKAEAAKNIQK